MRKVVTLLLILTVLLVGSTAPVSADVSSDDITVTVTGNGTWSNTTNTLSVSLFPGQAKIFTVTVNSTAEEDIQVSPVIDPSCIADGLLMVCFVPTNATLVAGGSCVFNLTITAKGNAPPSLFSSNLTIEADTEVIEPPPNLGVPHHVTLVSAQSEQVVGDPYDLTATVYDSANTSLPNISVGWSVLNGTAILSPLDLVTSVNGQACATANCTTVGTSRVRCKVEGADVLGIIDLTWIENDDDDVVTVPNIRQPVGGIAFGEVLVDGDLDRTTTIYNDGNAPLVIASVVRGSGSADFVYIGPLAPFTVGSGGSTVITVRFTPSSVGDLSATFTVTSNDLDTPGLSFTVSGTGKSRGKPAWLVFLIGVLIIGGCFGGFFYYKRWRARRSSLDVLARAGGGEAGDAGDVLDLD